MSDAHEVRNTTMGNTRKPMGHTGNGPDTELRVPTFDTNDVRLYRVQAADGRGPWRPGLSKHWIDDDSDRPLQPDVLAAFGMNWLKKIPQGWYAGCACRTQDALLTWFTPVEQTRLEAMGYAPVALTVDKIIEENADQVVFARRTPFYIGAILLPWRKTA